MIKDNVYFWEQIGLSYPRQLLGECQYGDAGVNMSFVIDGTRDSTKLIVYSFTNGEVVKPNTIIWHENTDTYWIVGDDKVERYANESGWYYKHTLQLEGAIELLNARDLTDNGFNQNTYTIEQFARRLFLLSNFELNDTAIIFLFGNNLANNKKVDYLKTFENYTLLSALREFFEGYNCSLKLSFVQNSGTSHYIQSCYVEIIPKTGNIDRDIKTSDDVFDEIKEIKTLNKSSYGTTVVSNAENIVSTKSKLYPSVGYAKVGGENYIIKPDDAVLRLPSKVNSVEYVDMLKIKINVTIGRNEDDFYGSYMNDAIVGQTSFDATNVYSFDRAIDWIKTKLMSEAPSNQWVQENTDDEFWESAKGRQALNNFLPYAGFRFYNINEYDPLTNKFLSEHNINVFGRIPDGIKQYVLGSKELRNGVQEPKQVMYWERGSNLIKGFDFFNWFGVSNTIQTSDKQGVVFVSFTVQYGGRNYHYTVIFGDYTTGNTVAGFISPANMQFSLLDSYFKVKYIPMGDLKIKYDNVSYGKDIQLYNQNGKFIDGVALSKLLVSYKDKIVSDNITKYKIAYSFEDMPKVGDIIELNNDKYVINNVSLDFYQNEEINEQGYYLVGEFTLSKNIATKSLLTNPNTNIRDYVIPQNYNVKRKQLYRDFYELGYSIESSDLDYYMPFGKILNRTNFYKEYDSHTAIMELTFTNAYGGGGETYDGGTAPASNKWYYQLESTVFYFKKAMYEIIDFQDNNIIGYDSQNVSCGFDIRRLFDVMVVGTANIDTINTPISYVDDKGQVKGFTIEMCSDTQLMDIYDRYIQEQEAALGETYDKTLYNRCVFIPEEIFEKAEASGSHDYEIIEESYYKDALEIPVFEYSCQIDDSEDVIIGENILDYQEDDFRYLYEIVFVKHGLVDNNTWTKYISETYIQYDNNNFYINHTSSEYRKCLLLTSQTNMLGIQGYNRIDVNRNKESNQLTGNVDLGEMVSTIAAQEEFDGKVDIVLLRYTIKNNYSLTTGDNAHVTNVNCDLLMVLKNAQNCPINLNDLRLYINHYKLK